MKKILLLLLLIFFGMQGFAQADMAITNTNNQSAFIPGYPSVYIVTVTNYGPNDANNVTVTNPIPAGITQFSWVGSDGSSGTNVPLSDLIPIFNNGDTITYTITLVVPAGYTGTLTSQANVVSVTPIDTIMANNMAADVDIAPVGADIVVVKTDNDLTYTAGTTQTYTITLANHGPAAATNVTIDDAVPAGIVAANVIWTGDNGTSGTGALSDIIANMAVGDIITYTVIMPVPSNFDQNTDLTNTVVMTSGTADPNPLCVNCADTDTPDPHAIIDVTKDDGITQYLNDEDNTYTITVTNNGPSDAANVVVTDNMPTGVTVMAWSGDNGSSGTGNLLDNIVSLPFGQTITYTVTLHIPLNYNTSVVNLTNMVSVASDSSVTVAAVDIDTPRPKFVTVDTTTYTVPQLVEDILIDSDCANVSNFTQQIGAGANIGVGYFHRNNSTFPIKSGVVMRCGRAKACEGPFTDGNTSTTGSNLPDNNSIGYPSADNQDLHGVSVGNGNPGSINDVSYIQFDFVPLTNNFSFKFLFASNEYGTYQCTFGDVFAFILKDQVTGTMSNLAVIPATTTPVSVTSIRDASANGGCVSVNPSYFDVYNVDFPATAAIDMRGQTIPMVASSAVIPNHLYSIKLVIGDYQDTAFDSAVFMEAGSFDVGQANLGDDFLTNAGSAVCDGETVTLQTGLDPAGYTFSWYENTNLLVGETSPSLVVHEAGVYQVIAANGTCQQKDSVTIEYLPPLPVNQPADITQCSNLFDLTQIETAMLGTLNPSNYDISYYHTHDDAVNAFQPIAFPTADPAAYTGTNGEIIYVRVDDTATSGCYIVKSFTLHISNCGSATDPGDQAVCDDITNDGVAVFNLDALIPTILGTNSASDYTITFHATQADANNGVSPLVGTSAFMNTPSTQTIYVRMENNTDPTSFSTVAFDLIVHPQPATPTPSDVTVCDTYTLPSLAAGQSYHSASGGAAATVIAAGTAIIATQTIYIFAESGTTPNCTAEGDFIVTVNHTPVAPTPSDVTMCDSYVLPALPAGQSYHAGTAAGAVIAQGTAITTTQAIAIVDHTGTAPDCSSSGSFTVTINVTPPAPAPSDVTVCDTYTLPALGANQSYHAGTATGAVIAVGTNIITTQTIVIVAQTGTSPDCSSSGSFTVTVNHTPAAPTPSDVTMCDSYVLPALPAGQSYHAGTAAGAVIAQGTAITTTQAIAIVDHTGTAPDCSSSGSFTVTINVTPPAPAPLDVTVCDTYTLPALGANQSYHAGTATGAVIAVGTNIITTQTIVIVAQTGTTPDCSSSGSFTVTVNHTPAAPAPSDVTMCDSYVLPALPAGQSYHAGTATGAVVAAGTAITTTQAIAIVDHTGTTPDCSSSGSFTVTINVTPPAPAPSDVTVCDTYTLPALPANQSYHSATGGAAATLIAAGANIATTQTIYVFAQTGTAPNCSAEGSFTVTVNHTPVADDPSDVTACDSYTLPALNTGSYFSGPGGTGTPHFAGDVITASQPMYVYAQTGTTPNCFSENDFSITIFNTPVINTPSDYHVCDDNNDGFSCLFVLSTRNTQVTTAPGLTVSYHETLADAQNGVNAVNPANYCNIVGVHQTIYVRGFDPADPLCAATTTLELYVDPVPVPNPVISDYRLCDVNNPGDGVEGFDLLTKNLEILNGQVGLDVSYYLNFADAQSAANPINTTGFYANVSNPQQIWVRLTTPVTGCFAVSSFNLVVDPLPLVSAPIAINECGTASGIAQFDLAAHSLDISGGIPGTSVSYYLSQADALSGTGPLSNPYTNISNPQTVYAAVSEAAHGCVNTTTVTLTVSQGPAIGTPAMLQVCDPNNDGLAQFDLTDSYVDVTGSNPPPAGTTVTFHETMTDAQTGHTPIATSYFNIVPYDQTVYVRATYDATGCYSIVPLALHVNDTPQATDIGSQHVCDDDTDGIGTFDLTLYTPQIMGSYAPANHTLAYYPTQGDAQADTNAITNLLGFHNTTPGTQTIWVRLQDTGTGCFDVIPLVLVVDPKPALPPTPTGAVTPYTLCDVNNPGDEKEQFDLDTKIPEILGGQTGVTVGFYLTQADAQAQANALPGLYTNITNAQTLWVRLQNAAGCFVFTTMDLRVEPLPVLVPPARAITICDPDGDGFGLFDLQALIPAMLQGAPDINVSFHETLADAQGGANPITANPYPNITPFVQIIYVRAVNTITGCSNTMAIELDVIASPVVPPLDDQTRCDQDADNQDGFTVFDLTTQESAILAAQTGPATGYTITYHLTQADAQDGSHAIFNVASYTNTANPQTIWVSVRDSGGDGCFNVGSFTLHVNAPLALTTPSQLTICDDGPTSAVPQAVFDLTVKDSEITGGAPGYTVSYYQTQDDAQAGTNAIADPHAYTNNPNPQTLFVAVTGPVPSACRSYTTLTIRVLPLPVPMGDSIPALEACDDNAPVGTESFDLTQNEDYIRANDPGLAFEYYASESDADTRTNAITTPAAYESASGFVWIRVMRNTEANSLGGFCYVIVREELIVHPLPSVQPASLTACDPAAALTAPFTLSDADAGVIGADPAQAVADFGFAYYLTLADAQGGTNQLPDSYTNVTNPQDLSVVVTNLATGCKAYALVTLTVKAGATSVTPADYASCDTDFNNPNGVMTLNLTDHDAEILGAQDPALFTVAYFATAATAAAGTPELPASYDAMTGTIYAVVTNTATGCRSDAVALHILIEPLATPTIENTSNSICVDFDGTLESGLTLTSSLSSDPGYTLEWSLGTSVVGTGPTYTITDPLGFGDYTVSATSNSALGCTSQPSPPFTVVQSGQAHIPEGTRGYVISNYFEDDQTITVLIDGNGAGSYQYQLDDGPILDNGGVFHDVAPRPDGQPHTITVYDFKGTGPDHCGPLVIQGIQLVDYPHYFTPNGDGVHDTWNISGLDSSAKIYIFDRYGKLLKQLAPNGDGWNGTYNGQPLPSTDYWFSVYYKEQGTTITPTTVNKEFKAHFSLKR